MVNMSERGSKASRFVRQLAKSESWAWRFVLISAGIHVAGFAYSDRLGIVFVGNPGKPSSVASAPNPGAQVQAPWGDAIVIELPKATDLVPDDATPDDPSAGASVARTDESPGRGGSPFASISARNLASLRDAETTTARLQNTRMDDQENRILSSHERATLVDERMARRPMELTFVASGKGFRYERLRPASPAKQGVSHAKDTALGEQNSRLGWHDSQFAPGVQAAAIEGQKTVNRGRSACPRSVDRSSTRARMSNMARRRSWPINLVLPAIAWIPTKVSQRR